MVTGAVGKRVGVSVRSAPEVILVALGKTVALFHVGQGATPAIEATKGMVAQSSSDRVVVVPQLASEGVVTQSPGCRVVVVLKLASEGVATQSPVYRVVVQPLAP